MPLWLWFAIKIAVILGVFFTMAAYAVWAERRVAGFIQDRYGPNRVGPFGLVQLVADVIKLAFKEEVIPRSADRVVHFLAPAIVFSAAIGALVFLPYDGKFFISDSDFAILWVFAMVAVGSYAFMLSGWASGSKYPLLGGTRAAAQIISYEVPLSTAALSVVLATGSLSLQDIVRAQDKVWFIVPLFPAFIVYLITMFAETNRLPFDLPEAEAELVGGYHTEYSSLRFAWFFAGEYANMLVASSMMTTLFLGGWKGPFLPGWLWFFIKVCALMFFMIWVRWTFPRLRYDQLMNLCWRGLVPVSVVFLAVVGIVKVLWIGG